MSEHKQLIATVWDDGLVTDLRLLDVLKQYHVRASFAFSPGVYGNKPTMNDQRSELYGYRLAKSDLLKFQDHDICNHTVSHLDLTKTTKKETRSQIFDGRRDLQKLFRQEVLGFVYPYGEWDSRSELCVRSSGHRYSRVTVSAQRSHRDTEAGRMLVPNCGWYSNIAPYLHNEEFVLLTGHTYHMEGQKDWDQVAELYKYLTSIPDARVVTMTELAIAKQMKYCFGNQKEKE